MKNYETITASLIKIKEISSYAPISSMRVVAYKGSNMQVFSLNSVSEEDKKYISDISKSVIFGKFEIGNSGQLPGIVLGAGQPGWLVSGHYQYALHKSHTSSPHPSAPAD